MKKFFIFFVLLTMPFFVQAETVDLKILAEDIRFSEDLLIAGDEVRIYATVYNIGDVDVSGYITFFQGSVPVGNSQVISVIAGGSPEEVYVDFLIPSGDFNLRAEIRGTDPEDTNESNNTAITSIFSPVFDDDRDGISNDEDNCPETANADQTDSDSDGLGDECDEDDDNDGLTDEIESELGTDGTLADTDGDGYADSDDAYPTDPDRFEIVEEVREVEEVEEESVSNLFSDIISEISESIAGTEEEEVGEVRDVREGEEVREVQGVEEEVTEQIQFSPNAIFRYTRDNWNTFTFQVLTASNDGVQYEWDFGDGVTSSRTEVSHTYDVSGAFTVELAMLDQAGEVSRESTVVFVPFFSMQNPVVLILLLLLAVFLLGGISAIYAISKKQGAQGKRKKVKKTKIRVKDED